MFTWFTDQCADTAPATSNPGRELFSGGPTYSPVQLFDVVEELFEEERRSKSRRRKLTLGDRLRVVVPDAGGVKAVA